MQDEDDAGDETSGKDVVELVLLIRRHISEVANLEGLREVEVNVTVRTRKELVLLPGCCCLPDCECGHLRCAKTVSCCGAPLERVQRPGSSKSRRVW